MMPVIVRNKKDKKEIVKLLNFEPVSACQNYVYGNHYMGYNTLTKQVVRINADEICDYEVMLD